MRLYYDQEPCKGENYTLFHNSRLQDVRYRVLDPVLKVEENKSESLTFQIPVRNTAYDKMVPLRTFIYVCENDNNQKISYALRVISYTTAADGTKTVRAEGMMSLLCDSYIAPYEYTSIDPELYFIYMVQAHNGQYSEADDPQHILHWTTSYTGSNIARASESYVRALDEIREKIIKLLPVVVRVGIQDTWISGSTQKTPHIVASMKAIPEYTEGGSYPTVQYRKNLLDVSQAVDGSDFYTCVLPLGKKNEDTGERLTIASVNDGSVVIHDTAAEALYGVITRIVEWDDVTVASRLKTKAQNALQSQQLLSALTVDAIPAGYLTGDAFGVSDIVHVVRSYVYNGQRGPQGYRYQIDAYVRCTGVEIHYDDRTKDKYKFGNAQIPLTERLQK